MHIPRISGVKKYALAHKAITLVVLIIIFGGGYWAYAKKTAGVTETRYIMGTVATGTIVASVAESGQVATTNSIEVQPQVSGTITWVGVKEGARVSAGQALATVDDTAAKQSIADEEAQLRTDELNFQKSQVQAPIDYQNDQTALSNAQADLVNDYNDTFNDLTATYLDLPDVVTAAHDTIYAYNFDPKRNQWNMDALSNLFVSAQMDTSKVTSFKNASVDDYTNADKEYETALTTYQGTSRDSGNDKIDSLLGQSITMTTDVAESLQTELNFLGAASNLAKTYDVTLPAAFSTVQGNASTNLATVNADLSKLLSDKRTLDSAKQAITNAENTLKLDQVGNNADGSNPISLQVSANSIAKEKQDIETAQDDLAKYTIRAPFAGIVSTVNATVGQTAGSSIATVVTNTQVAELSLNEVDAAKVKVGDKVTLTFDAIDGLSLTGTVSEIDAVGTVSSGVVSYDMKVTFDTQDPRVKPGMTVDANIETGIAQNTLTVPSSAVKTMNGQSFVQVFNPEVPADTIAAAGAQGITSDSVPIMVPVTTGIADDTNVQILSGLSAGQQIVVSTRAGSVTASAAAATNRAAGNGGGFGGGAIRAGGAGAIRIGG